MRFGVEQSDHGAGGSQEELYKDRHDECNAVMTY